MIIIILFGLVAAVFIGLNILDNSNISKIEEHFKAQQCKAISYVSGTYQGVCQDKIILMKNAFSVDTSKPEKLIYYKDIKNISKQNKQLTITTTSGNVLLDFKEDENLNEFFNEVQNKL